MTLPKYTPYLDGQGGVKIGLTPISESKWLEIDNKFEEEIRLKKKLLKTNRDDVLQITQGSEDKQNEILESIVSYLQKFHSDIFKVTKDSVYIESTNDLYKLNQFKNPIELASLLVQEDLVMMSPKEDKFYLEAASLSAPSHWSLTEKFSKSLMDLHHGVPGYKEDIGQRVDEIFNRLPTERILERFNWSIYDDPKLFQPVHSKPFVEFKESKPSKLFLRVERQTIRKLPVYGTVLFTIRVYVDPIESILNDEHTLTSLKMAVENLSEPMKKYKSIDQLEKTLLLWLKDKIN
ncbi:MAG: heme-dependent oxidative N-demethylase family protein [Gammaproteobacteria bacterium]